MPVATAPRTVHVEQCMGTVFSVDIRDDGDWTEAIADAVAWLHRIDAVFSTYRSDSDISRLDRGEVTLDSCDADVREVLELCVRVQRDTGGWFAATINGRLDPSGLVKGWAVERASRMLSARGATNHALGGGGDVQTAGATAPGSPWVVGIANPFDRSQVLTTVTGYDLAIATSGTAERGRHITNPFTGRPAASDVVQVTVVGAGLTTVDAYATAAFAMGPQAIAWADSVAGIEALAVSADGTVTGTRGWHSLTGT